MSSSLLLIFYLLFCLTVSTHGECIDYGEYMQWLGCAKDFPLAEMVAVAGDFAYITYSNGSPENFWVVDISNPSTPETVAALTVGNVPCFPIASGNYVFIYDCHSGDPTLDVVDVSTPESPFVTASLPMSAVAYGTALANDHLYVATSWTLEVVDVSDPTAPFWTGNLVGLYTYGIAVAGNYAYLGGSDQGVHVVDVSDPGAPFLAHTVLTPHWAGAMCMSGDLVIACCDYYLHPNWVFDLTVIDASEPTSAWLAGSVPLPHRGLEAAASGDRVYIADQTSGLRIVDISDPMLPSLVGGIRTPQPAQSIALEEARAYVAAQGLGLHIFELGPDPPPPPDEGPSIPTLPRGLDVAGDYAYVAYGRYEDQGLQIFDISDPVSPDSVGNVTLPDWGNHVVVKGDYAYVADRQGLQVVDVSIPEAPIHVNSYGLAGEASGVSVSGDSLYLAENPFGLRIYDLGIPSSPNLVESIETPGTARRVVRAGDYVYVADYGQGLQIVDLFSADSLFIAGSLTLTDDGMPVAFLDVEVEDDYAYVSTWSSSNYLTIQVIDVSDPTAPVGVGSHSTMAIGHGIDLAEGYLYVAERYPSNIGCLQIFDVADPNAPLPAATFDPPVLAWEAFDILVRDEEVFAIGGGYDGTASQLIALPAQCSGIGVAQGESPARLAASSYPNPFNPRTMLQFTLPRTDRICVSVHDVAGRRLAVLYEGKLPAGGHELEWDGRNEEALAMSSGVYLYRIQLSNHVAAGRMVLIK